MNEYITTGSFNLGNQITLKNVNSNIDRDYGPYEDKTLTEIADLLKDTIQIGKTIGVIEEGKIVEYWWQKEGDVFKFVLKQNSGVVDITDDAIRLLFVKRQPNNEIWYTSTDGNVVTPYGTRVFGANIVSNTYENDKGVITFNRDVTSFGDSAFSSRSSLTSITIPNQVTSIGSGAFSGCSRLTSITIPNSVTSIGDEVFYNCNSLKSITLPNGLTSIGRSAFYRCSSLTSVTIPESVTSIGSYAFENCSNFISITIPNGVTKIEYGTFYGCQGLNSVTIPNSVTSIGGSAFIYCNSLTSITIPNSVTSIGDIAFFSCNGLTSVIIGNSTMSIGNEAFAECRSLTSITFEGTIEKWNSITKGSKWNNKVPATYVQCTNGQVTL